MKIAIIIPAHNEADYIKSTLISLKNQSHKASKIILVDDNSTDDTSNIAHEFSGDLPLEIVTNKSSDQNIPGSKVIRAFEKGLSRLNLDEFDVVCKFDADLIFPANYLKTLVSTFNSNEQIGMVGGHCVIQQKGHWILENQNNPDHIRGALKAYRVSCFKQINGIRPSIGWDTVDEMLARYYDFKVITVPNLHVKHLKPTGSAYRKGSWQLQGEAFYKMRYGWWLTMITALKMSLNKKKFSLFFSYLSGYLSSKKNNLDPIVTEDQGRFIRQYRWRGIKKKLRFKN